MSVSSSISLLKVKQEIEEISVFAGKCGWLISDIDEPTLTFRVKMTSPIDQENYIMEIKFDNYPEIPPLIEFIDPISDEKGTKRAYPKSKDSFFHGAPCICNPFSRKSYKEFDPIGPHQDWKMIGWQNNPKAGSIKNIGSILKTIYVRISTEDFYHGRMAS